MWVSSGFEDDMDRIIDRGTGELKVKYEGRINAQHQLMKGIVYERK